MGGRMVELGAGRVLAFAAVIVVSLGSTWSGSAVASDDSTSGEPRETTQRRIHGTITAVSATPGTPPVPVNHNRMIILELEVLGAYNYSTDGFGPAVDLLAGGAVPIDLLLEPEDVPLDGVMDAMERMSRGEIPGKVLVNPEVRRP